MRDGAAAIASSILVPAARCITWTGEPNNSPGGISSSSGGAG
jgi:hypothetical protein